VSNLDDFDISAIRNKINEFYCVKKQVPTLRTLYADLKESIEFSGCCETLRKILHKNGFQFKRNKEERSILMENFEISGWRQRYLRTVHQKRQEGKLIVYLDETYVHQNYRPKKSWQGPSTSGVVDKISPGKRHIIVHAGSEEGFVPNALLVFSTKSKAADYHDDMNSANFLKWLRQMLIPNLTKPSVIVMDNASYHVTQMNKPPTMQSLKSDIQKWLTENKIPYEESYKKAELMCLVNEHKIGPVYEAEEILKQHGHEVIKLPPYHCDLNAIELIWSLAKRKVASRNLGLPGSDTENLIRECFAMITAEDWKRCTDHIINVEEKYKTRDNILDTELVPFIIQVRESDDDSDHSLSDIEFLESDFDYDS
jgi:transposase